MYSRLSNATAYSYVIETLLKEGGAIKDLHEDSGLGDATIRKLVMCLRKRGILYVCGWEKDRLGRACAPIYKLGSNKDVPKPKPRSQKDKDRDSYDRRKEVSLRLGIPFRDVRMKVHAVPVLFARKQSKSRGISSA